MTVGKPFDMAAKLCDQDGSEMVTISSDSDQKSVNDFLRKVTESDNLENYKGVWLGLTDKEGNGEMEWIHHGPPYYTNWVFGEPEATQVNFKPKIIKLPLYYIKLNKAVHPGRTCGYIESGSERSEGQWSAEYCRVEFSVICQKLAGQACPEGWSFQKIKGADYASSRGNKCLKFFLNGHYHLPWYEQYQYCKSIGARPLHIQSEEEQKDGIINRFFYSFVT